jgi:hypothetical protein
LNHSKADSGIPLDSTRSEIALGIEWDVGLIGENDVHAIGAISAVKPNELWAQRVCFENFLGHFTFLGTPEPSD